MHRREPFGGGAALFVQPRHPGIVHPPGEELGGAAWVSSDWLSGSQIDGSRLDRRATFSSGHHLRMATRYVGAGLLRPVLLPSADCGRAVTRSDSAHISYACSSWRTPSSLVGNAGLSACEIRNRDGLEVWGRVLPAAGRAAGHHRQLALSGAVA